MIEAAVRMGVALLPSEWRFRVVRHLASRPARAKVSPSELLAMAVAQPIRLGADQRIPAWTWGEGPMVALVHGWGGRAAQMAPMALHLANNGFCAVAFDLTAHGESRATEAGWDSFVRDIADAAHALGPLSGFVGHSAGGLALSAARALAGVQADRFVCICAPHHPYPPLQIMARRLNPGEKVLQRYRDLLGSQLQVGWSALEAGRFWRELGPETMLCYDEKDRYIDHSDGDRILALSGGIVLVKTRQHGHVRILSADDVLASITRFLKTGKPQAAHLRAVL
jgi:pimeloyl-ACP methyl ester carboxylesterase